MPRAHGTVVRCFLCALPVDEPSNLLIDGPRALHIACYARQRGDVCSHCKGAITEKILEALGKKWHPECFKCHRCHEVIEGGKVHSEKDDVAGLYQGWIRNSNFEALLLQRKHGTKGTATQESSVPFAMKENDVYHIKCLPQEQRRKSWFGINSSPTPPPGRRRSIGSSETPKKNTPRTEGSEAEPSFPELNGEERSRLLQEINGVQAMLELLGGQSDDADEDEDEEESEEVSKESRRAPKKSPIPPPKSPTPPPPSPPPQLAQEEEKGTKERRKDKDSAPPESYPDPRGRPAPRRIPPIYESSGDLPRLGERKGSRHPTSPGARKPPPPLLASPPDAIRITPPPSPVRFLTSPGSHYLSPHSRTLSKGLPCSPPSGLIGLSSSLKRRPRSASLRSNTSRDDEPDEDYFDEKVPRLAITAEDHRWSCAAKGVPSELKIGSVTWQLSEISGGGATGGTQGALLLGTSSDRRRAACKILPAKDCSTEVSALTAVAGQGVVRLLHHIPLSRKKGMLMTQWEEGGDLHQRLASGEGLSERLCRHLFSQILRTVHRCHRLRWAHHDIRPENILLSAYKGPAVLADFGVARRYPPGEVSSAILGSPLHMAPEVLLVIERRKNNYDPFAADMWALGVLLYQMLASRDPKWIAVIPEGLHPGAEGLGTTPTDSAVRRLRKAAIRGPGSLPSHISPAAAALVKALLNPNASERPTCAQAFHYAWIVGAAGGGIRKGISSMSSLPAIDELLERELREATSASAASAGVVLLVLGWYRALLRANSRRSASSRVTWDMPSTVSSRNKVTQLHRTASMPSMSSEAKKRSAVARSLSVSPTESTIDDALMVQRTSSKKEGEGRLRSASLSSLVPIGYMSSTLSSRMRRQDTLTTQRSDPETSSQPSPKAAVATTPTRLTSLDFPKHPVRLPKRWFRTAAVSSSTAAALIALVVGLPEDMPVRTRALRSASPLRTLHSTPSTTSLVQRSNSGGVTRSASPKSAVRSVSPVVGTGATAARRRELEEIGGLELAAGWTSSFRYSRGSRSASPQRKASHQQIQQSVQHGSASSELWARRLEAMMKDKQLPLPPPLGSTRSARTATFSPPQVDTDSPHSLTNLSPAGSGRGMALVNESPQGGSPVHRTTSVPLVDLPPGSPRRLQSQPDDEGVVHSPYGSMRFASTVQQSKPILPWTAALLNDSSTKLLNMNLQGTKSGTAAVYSILDEPDSPNFSSARGGR
eukprot:Sspe_Gene.84465::Locus_55450_Transcript_2_2_Confidence_0.667_Length_3900::g.84465::m.84465